VTAAILQKSAWLYTDNYTPQLHHYFDVATKAPTKLSSTTNTAPTLLSMAAAWAGKPMYKPVPTSANFMTWKSEQGIAVEVFVYRGSPPPTANMPLPKGATIDTYIPSYQMCVSDNDTLTQPAMLKAPDKDDFLNAQVLKVQGLHYSGELSYHPTAMLPPKAHLLSAIWSYQQNRTTAGLYCGSTKHGYTLMALSSKMVSTTGRHMLQ
jgi:hypothetical protein